jgi:VanZ family protein
MKEKIAPKYLACIALYCTGIFYMSAQSRIEQAAPGWLEFPGADKLAHLFIYAGLTLLVSWAIRQSNESPRPWVQWGAPILFAACYGITDEIHQYYVPNRDMDPLDLLADAAGAILIQSIWCGKVWRVPLRKAVT